MRKKGTRPTRGQAEFIKTKMRLNPENWLVSRDNTFCFEIVNRITGNRRKVSRKNEGERNCLV